MGIEPIVVSTFSSVLNNNIIKKLSGVEAANLLKLAPSWVRKLKLI